MFEGMVHARHDDELAKIPASTERDAACIETSMATYWPFIPYMITIGG